ncbi:ethanolaminephosphotransferase [Acrasis kona]|uniref:Ethanolaminephosphotransferase n=1 Tax=Acrasis kona TaxID=1008807 RepID=A0AAW2YUP1_9EUKA
MSSLFDYVGAQGRRELRTRTHYKFSVDNVSIGEKYILNPFWNFVTNNLYPEWLAPNTITLMGFVCMVIVGVLLWIAYPMVTYYSLWILIVIPILMFLYQTLDGSDGKQARRTGSSSPLGEIFDHGVDAICLTIFILCLCATCGVTPLNKSPFYICSVLAVYWFGFFTAHWEHYHTGTFYMGYIGPCDAQVAIILMFIIAFFSCLIAPGKYPHGGGVWTTEMLYGITIGDALVFIVGANAVGAVIKCSWSIYSHFKTTRTRTRRNQLEEEPQLGDEFRANPGRQLLSALTDLLPLCLMTFIFFSWIILAYCAKINEHEALSDGTVISYSNLLERDFMWYTYTCGVVFGVFLTTLNVSRVTYQVFPRFASQFVFSLVGVIVHLVNLMIFNISSKSVIDPRLLGYFVFAYTVVYYLVFVILIGNTFCDEMGIRAFFITRSQPLEIHEETLETESSGGSDN